MVTIGSLMVQTVAVLLPIGIITNGLFMSGMSVSFASGLVYLGGGHLWAVILLGVVTCYIMGMAGLLSAAFILLAILMAPSLVNAFDLNPLAVHLFILYYSMLVAFTPPVAAAAFVAATIANASPMRVALRAVRLGGWSSIYFPSSSCFTRP